MNAQRLQELKDLQRQRQQELEACRSEARRLAEQHQEPYRVSMLHSGRFRVDSHYHLCLSPELLEDLNVMDDFYPEGYER